jgi:hypothetical protein
MMHGPINIRFTSKISLGPKQATAVSLWLNQLGCKAYCFLYLQPGFWRSGAIYPPIRVRYAHKDWFAFISPSGPEETHRNVRENYRLPTWHRNMMSRMRVSDIPNTAAVNLMLTFRRLTSTLVDLPHR